MDILNIFQNGLAAPEVAHHILHTAMGAFFAASGWNKLTNRGRHATLVETLRKDHVPALTFNQWWVPGWELTAGVMLIGEVFPAFAAAVLLVICLVAACLEGGKRVEEMTPINAADRVADWLYLPEVLYVIMLVALVLGA